MNSITAFLLVLVLLFGLLVVYPVVSNVLANLDYGVRNITEVASSSEATSTLDMLAVAWQYFPLMFVLAIFVWAFYLLSKRESVEYGYAE